MTTAKQIRNGRALLGWRPNRLATQAGLNIGMIKSYEEGTTDIDADAVQILRRILESAGVEFIPETVNGAGVRLRRSAP